MKRFKLKKVVCLSLIVLLVVGMLAGCAGSDEYELEQSFERNFYPAEYEEEYSEIEKVIELDENKDYKFAIRSTCKTGSLEISSVYSGSDEAIRIVNSESPCDDTITLSAGTSDKITFTIHLNADTEGSVIVEVLSR